MHFLPNTHPNELKIGTNSKQRTGNPNPVSKLAAESALTNKSIIRVVWKSKIDPNGLKLVTYAN
jgi:hypothetical protein